MRKSEAETTSWVPIGACLGPFGLEGWIRVHPFNPESTLFAELEKVWLRNAAGERLLEIEDAKTHASVWLLRLRGVGDRDEALALKGYELVVPREWLPPPSEDEFYHHDLIGLKVREGDREWGRIRRVLCYPSADCLEVEEPSGAIREVPLVEDFVQAIDLKAGEVHVSAFDSLPQQAVKKKRAPRAPEKADGAAPGGSSAKAGPSKR